MGIKIFFLRDRYGTTRNLNFFVFCVMLFFFSCKEKTKTILPPQEIVTDINALPKAISNQIQSILDNLSSNPAFVKGVRYSCYPVLNKIYDEHDFHPLWIQQLTFRPQAQTFLSYVKQSARDGLFRTDYHYDSIKAWQSLLLDSLNQHDALLWAKFDLALTDGFLHVVQDLKQGRLQPDSLAWSFSADDHFAFFKEQVDEFFQGQILDTIIHKLQPVFPGYDSLHLLLSDFLEDIDTMHYTYVKYPFKKGDQSDSLKFIQTLANRLVESGLPDAGKWDSVSLSNTIKAYQKRKGAPETGKFNEAFISMLNLTDRMRFNRIAITLDRYKAMPEVVPAEYILVNIPAFQLWVYQADTIALTSRVICGKPTTPTPFLSGAISQIITMPTWTVPTSIIKKEIIPGMKRDPGYLHRKGLSLYNNKDEWIDPSTLNWQKYANGIPYRVVQGSGDDNALGVIKFNFFNLFDVYLHDTNQRYLFKKIMRALSHGCVRVEQWENLAGFIARNDSLKLAKNDTLRYNTDSIQYWIGNKERHNIRIKNKLPLYIRYFTCMVQNGKIHFLDDVYNDDKHLNEKYFQNRKLIFN